MNEEIKTNNNMENNKHLFLFTITNVQNFIAQARKTLDLFAGSRLLSDLMRIAAKETQKCGTLIFPSKAAIDNPENLASLSHRILARVENKSPKELKQLGNDIQEAVEKHLVEQAQKRVKEKSKEDKLPVGFDQQINQLLDIKWVFIKETNDYATDYQNLERSLGAIKNVRKIEQYSYQQQPGEKGRKCSVDGERNVKFYRKTDEENKADKLPKKLFIKNKNEICIPKHIEYKIIDKNEGLSAVSMLKRCYFRKIDSFPSTADVCLLQLKHENKEFSEKSVEFEGLFDESKFLSVLTNTFTTVSCGNFQDIFLSEYNSQFLFDENLTEKRIPNKEQLKWVKNFHKEHIYKFVKRDNRYYALLRFDGDSMGKWLSGEKLKTGANLNKFHNEISGLLYEFSTEAIKIVTEPKGKTIYAGGDDFLAFVNLEHLYDVMLELKKMFKEKVNDELKKKFEFKEEYCEITFSAGVVIAHYKTPLGIVVEKSHEMETKAKELDGKNAFAIAVMKHSGEVNHTQWKWTIKDNPTIDILKTVTENLRLKFSNKFIQVLDAEFERLSDKDGYALTGITPDLIESEICRLINRAKDKKAIEKAGEDVESCVKKFAKSLYPLLEKQSTDKTGGVPLKQFIDALHIADFIKRHTNGLKTEENGK